MSDLRLSPGQSEGTPEPSDEEVRSWYTSLSVNDPHIPPPVEPDIELLREALGEFNMANTEAARWAEVRKRLAQVAQTLAEVMAQAAAAATQLAQAAAEAAEAEPLEETEPQAETRLLTETEAAAVAQVSHLVELAARLAEEQAARLRTRPVQTHVWGQDFEHRARHRAGMRHP